MDKGTGKETTSIIIAAAAIFELFVAVVPPDGPRLERPVVPRRLVAVALLGQRPMKVTPFGRSPRFLGLLRKNFASASLRREMFMSGLVVRHGSLSGAAVLYPRPGPERGIRPYYL